MVRSAGPVGRRATCALLRRLSLPAVAVLAQFLAACSDKAPLTPAQHSVVATLPAATHYLIALGSPGKPSSALTAAIQAAGGRILRAHAGTGIVVVGGLSQSAANALRTRSDIGMMMADFTFKLRPDLTTPVLRTVGGARRLAARTVTPRALTDPRQANFYSGYQWNMKVIQADTAWQITNQGTGTKVYILDTGVDSAHIDLRGRIDLARSTTFAYAPTDTLQLNPLPVFHDVVGHGTFVSSMITTNSINLAGVAPQATVVMVRVFDDEASSTFEALIDGLLYAADSSADVINMSLGGYLSRVVNGDNYAAEFLTRVVQYARARNVLVVAAAGNEGVDWNTASSALSGSAGSYVDSLEYPGGIKNVMSIGATAPIDQANFDRIATYSNYGAPGVGVFAPGGDLVDTLQVKDLILGACSSARTDVNCAGDTTYVFEAGTSFASPTTVGEALVIKGQHTGITNTALETCILTTATEVTGVRPDPNYNYGRIDVLNAVNSSSCQ